MSNIKNFNNMLNNSVKNHNEQNVEYRNQISTFINDIISSNTDLRTCCVIGAGKLNDIPLASLNKAFNEILLTDIDIQSTIKSLNNSLPKIRFKEVEYTGFEAFGFFDDFIKIKDLKTNTAIETFIQTKMKEIESYKFMTDSREYYDFIYISPIYTQLIYNQVLLECSKLRKENHTEHLIAFIEQEMLNQMMGVIHRFNANISEIAKQSGIIMVLSDIFEYQIGSPFGRKIEAASSSTKEMDKIHSAYINQYGMGLGDYGLYSMSEICHLESSKWLIWPLIKNKHFVVKCNIYKKK